MLSLQSPRAGREPDTSVGTGARIARPRVLVLLAACNGAPWIREQIDSVLGQEQVDVLLAIRDDGSTDRTLAELERFARNPRIRLLPSQAPTGSAAGNFLSLIRDHPAEGADFVAFCDQDDLWDRDKLFKACRTLTAATTAAGYSSATVAAWADGRRRVLRPRAKQTSSDFLFEGAGQGCTFVLTAQFFERVRQFVTQHRDLTRELHYHDWAVYALARVWGLGWVFDRAPSMRYRQHAANDTGARGTFDGIARRLALIRGGWYRKQLFAIAELCAAAAPTHSLVAAWRRALVQPDGWRRRWQTTRLCVRGGRRRRRDNLVLTLSALVGWI